MLRPLPRSGELKREKRVRTARKPILIWEDASRAVPDSTRCLPSALFTVDRRINPEEDLETKKGRLLTILERLRSEGIRIEHEVLQEAPSGGVAVHHPVARVLAEAVEAVTGRAPSISMCPGLLETRFYAQAGVPALAVWAGPARDLARAERVCVYRRARLQLRDSMRSRPRGSSLVGRPLVSSLRAVGRVVVGVEGLSRSQKNGFRLRG